MGDTMNMNCERLEAPFRVREFLSLREATVLASVSEKRVRKDIETGVLTRPRVVRFDDTRLRFNWSHVFVFAAVYSNELLDGNLRKVAISKVEHVVSGFDRCSFWSNGPMPKRHIGRECSSEASSKVELDKYVWLDLDLVYENTLPRVGMYLNGLSRIEEKDDVLGGEAVFCGRRLSVMHVGKMYDKGEPLENILEDYPYLSEEDVKFASLYFKAHPLVGRPRSGGDHDYGGACTG